MSNEIILRVNGVEIPLEGVTISPQKREPVIKFWSPGNIQDNWQADAEEFKPSLSMLSYHRKIAFVSPSVLMEFFGNWKHAKEYLRVVQFDECEGATVLNVFYKPENHMFGIELARMDWPYVEPGTVSPTLNSSGACRVVKIEAKPL